MSTDKPHKKVKIPAKLQRGGMVVGPFHSEPGGGPKFKLSDTGQVIEEEGFEFNIPEEITRSNKIYTFTGKNVEIIHKILKLAGLSAFDKVTSVKSGDIVICIKSAWDDEIRTITGTITEILSAINTSCGCKPIEEGAKVIEHGTSPSNIQNPISLNESGGSINPETLILNPNSDGGYDYEGQAKKVAKSCGLVTLPQSIEGTNCGNCIFFKDNFCDHSKILLPVTSRMCCALWDDKSLRSHVTNIFDAYLFPDKSGKEFPLNENGGYDYTGKALETARSVDLITLPKDIKGTNCAVGNCKYAKTDAQSVIQCIHPKILLPVTDRMSCGWWDNDQVERPWGKPEEIKFAGGGKVSYKQKLKDWQAEDPNSPRWKKKKERITQLSNNIQKLRNKVSRDLNSDDEKEFLTALVIAIMDKTGERVGNDASAGNGHFGVTGFTKKHVNVIGSKVILDYKGKSGVDHEKDFSDEKIASSLKKAIKRSPSKLIFTTSDNFHIKGDRINRYLESFGISSKNLRGYFANQNIIKLLKREDKKEQPENEKQRKKIFNRVLKQTAQLVGHGSPTLRKHYLIPEIPIEYIEKGNIIDLKTLGYYKEGGDIKPLETSGTLFRGNQFIKYKLNDDKETYNVKFFELHETTGKLGKKCKKYGDCPIPDETEATKNQLIDYITKNNFFKQGGTMEAKDKMDEGGSAEENEIINSASNYGWKAEKNSDGNYELFNRKGNKVVTIKQKGNKYSLFDNGNNKLMSGRGEIGNSIKRLLTQYYFAQPISSNGGSIDEDKIVYWNLPKVTPVHNVEGTKIIIEKYGPLVTTAHGEQLWKVYIEQPNGTQYWDKTGFSYEGARKRAKDLKETIEAGYEIIELTKK